MSDNRAMWTVQDEHGTARVILDLDQDVPRRRRAELQALLDDVLARIAAETGVHPREAPWLLAGFLVRRHADAEAYDREAARRGLLPL